MSKGRKKRKQRQRARAASGGGTSAAARGAASGSRAKGAGDGATAATRGKGSGSRAKGAGAGATAATRGHAAGADATRPHGKADRAPGPDVRDGVARPKPIWAPFPLTEIGMAVGIILFGLGFEADGARGTRLLTIGAAVLSVVVGELCLREHLSGYRSHTLLLAALPVAIAHPLVYTAITDAYAGPLALTVDLAVAGGLAWLLRARFEIAHERARTAPP